MKSIALKTNNSQTVEYLIQELSTINLDDIYYSHKIFKHYNNIIIHYIGSDDKTFINKISSILSFLVIYDYEDDILKNIIYRNYFYFSNCERKIILKNCFDIMVDSKHYLKDKYETLFNTFNNYINLNRNIFINGFINFRLTKYLSILNSIVDDAVNSFIVEKEYEEFISLLKLYINSNSSNSELIHIIYSKDFTFILDENKNIIKNSTDIPKAKFLSDISFSTNDYTLNSLLNLLPSKIYIHLIDNCIDEFIKTLCLIFEQKVSICTECNICALYRKNSEQLKK